MKNTNILETVASEKLGFSFGKPIRVDEKMLAVVLPILRSTSLKRQYITFPETELVFVTDTGAIDAMEAHNQTEENVFIRSGTLFRGATQERALMRSAIVFPGKKQKLGVRCVHASRGINPTAPVKYGGLTPHSFDAANYSHGYTPKDQSAFWANVKSTTNMMNMAMGKKSASPANITSRLRRYPLDGHSVEDLESYTSYFSAPVTSMGGSGLIGSDAADTSFYGGTAFGHEKSDDLYTTFNDFSMHFDDVLSKVKLVDNQAGLALINQNGVETIEFFDHKDSWKVLHESAIKRLGSNIVNKDNESVFEYKPENAIKQVNRILAMDFKLNRIYEHRPSNGEPHVEITGLSADGYVGEAVEVNGDLMHLVLLRQTN